MEFSEQDGIIDLRPKSGPRFDRAPRCYLIEVNARPPGFCSVAGSAGVYGVNYYDLHVLACLRERDRLRALAKPFNVSPSFVNHTRAWSQIVVCPADKGGLVAPHDPRGDFLQRLSPSDQALVTEKGCLFSLGQTIPEPEFGCIRKGAYFVTSRTNRRDVLRDARILQQDFRIPVTAEKQARLSIDPI